MSNTTPRRHRSLDPHPACGSPIEKAIDCRSSCKVWKDCASADFDVDKCAKRCREKDKGEQADACADCLHNEDFCAEKRRCAKECAGFLLDLP